CWDTLRASMLQHSEKSQVRMLEKFEDWAISSQASPKGEEGSTTTESPKEDILHGVRGKNTRQLETAALVGDIVWAMAKVIEEWIKSHSLTTRNNPLYYLSGSLQNY